MDFNEKGFLGTAITEFTVSVESRYAQFFDASYRINELAHNTKFELQAHNRDGQEMLAVSVFIRLLNGFQGIVLLARLGLMIEAKVVLRSILESLFILRLLCEDEGFLNEYIRSDQVRRLQWMKIAHQNKDPHFESVRKHATSEVMESLRQEIAKHNCKKLNVEQVAQRAKLQSMYDADYRILSEEVHTLPRSLEHLTFDDSSGEIAGFNWGPSDDSLDYILFTAVRILLIGLVAVTKLFNVDKSDALAQIDGLLTQLASQLKA